MGTNVHDRAVTRSDFHHVTSARGYLQDIIICVLLTQHQYITNAI